MRIKKLVDRSFVPLTIISVVMIILTIISYYVGYKNSDGSVIKSFLHFFDLNLKFNGAMWISVFMWIISGLSFVMLGLNKSKTIMLSIIQKKFLVFLGAFICLLSFEKIFEFHLLIEFRAINFLGLFSENLRKDSPYYWLYYILAPVFLSVIINLFVVYYKLLKGMSSDRKLQTIAKTLYITALLSVPSEILFDTLQGYFWYSGNKHTVFNSIESIFELAGICCIIGGNKILAEFYSV